MLGSSLQPRLIPATLLLLFILASSSSREDSTSSTTVKEDNSILSQNEVLEEEEEYPANLILNLPQGKIKGKIFRLKNDRLVVGFLGLPYAAPPLRELRFRPPMPPKSWEGVFNATAFSPICPQPGDQKIYDVVSVRNRSMIRKRKLENYHMSEDCLTLNVYVPLVERDGNISLPGGNMGKLPVFFYIHGGSYYMGSGRFYPGQILASTQNLIVVTFNFRLGPLGFFSSGDKAATGNWGLLDQVQALNWVRENVGVFGGNRNHITLVGNSAGGASVMFHLVSPLSKDKFVGVTVQSGCSGAPWAVQHSPKKHAELLAKRLGCPTVPTTDMVDCIRTFSAKRIMRHTKWEDGLSLAFAATIDGLYGGKFLPAHPDQLISQNQFHHVPILTGFTRDEVTIWFTTWGPSKPLTDVIEFLKHDVVSLLQDDASLTPANQAAAFHSVKVQYMYRYGILENDTLGKTNAVSDFISDVGLKAPCIKEMNRLAQLNTKPVYLYEFNYFSVDDVKMGRQEWIGSYHESELQFIFGETYLNYSNHLRSYDDKKMSDLMMKIWANFARYGNPTPSPKGERTGLKFLWTNYTERNQDFAVLGLKSHMGKYFYTDRMLFWNFFFPIFRDYRFEYSDPSPIGCDDWQLLQKSWTFWSLLTLSGCLAFLLSLGVGLYFRKSSGLHPGTHTRITKWYKNNSFLPGGGGGGASSPRGAATSPLNHQNSIVVSPPN